ncbi:hypothetical protein GN244_ATG17991 [Phytophthora infestans]|uniref:Uncharacterized protein n=1 Tax=Phytophthora infestans TaxID=4787 RepID=A0A833SX45_PHYIN|nr:hypothetical protein GN244_ATG18181 [Phytophthora infestans]KAF4030238.1 hypothetical protein GN244_ATG17991 [Phytophthora infestans]
MTDAARHRPVRAAEEVQADEAPLESAGVADATTISNIVSLPVAEEQKDKTDNDDGGNDEAEVTTSAYGNTKKAANVSQVATETSSVVSGADVDKKNGTSSVRATYGASMMSTGGTSIRATPTAVPQSTETNTMGPVTRAAARRAEEARRQSDANDVADAVEASDTTGIAQDATADEAQRIIMRATDGEGNNGDGEIAGTEINDGAAQELPVTGTVSEPEAEDQGEDDSSICWRWGKKKRGGATNRIHAW